MTLSCVFERSAMCKCVAVCACACRVRVLGACVRAREGGGWGVRELCAAAATHHGDASLRCVIAVNEMYVHNASRPCETLLETASYFTRRSLLREEDRAVECLDKPWQHPRSRNQSACLCCHCA